MIGKSFKKTLRAACVPFLFGEFLAPFNSEHESRLFYIWGKQAIFDICVRIAITKDWKRCGRCRLLFGELDKH